jgi:hypothetical protein
MEGTDEPHTDIYMENVNKSNYNTICMVIAIPIEGFTSAAQRVHTA